MVRGARAAGLSVAVALLLVASGAPAGAITEATNTVTAGSAGQGVDIVFERQVDGSARGRPAAGESTCDWRAEPFTESNWGPAPGEYGDQPSADHALFMIFCGPDYVGTRWLGPSEFVDGLVQGMLDRTVRRVVALPVSVSSAPEERGITGIESLFWVEGFGGGTLQGSESAFGVTVVVSAQLVSVEWDFGDGTPRVQGGLGEAWPDRSSVRHAYRDASPPGAPYGVTANLVLQPSYTVDGAPGEPLEPVVVTATGTHEVRQVQAVRRR